MSEPPYDRDNEDGESWMDDLFVLMVAGFASAAIILLVLMILNGP